jgi:hypothetical protein
MRGARRQSSVRFPITEAKTVKVVIESYREKYRPGDVKKYHSKFDVAVVVDLGGR